MHGGDAPAAVLPELASVPWRKPTDSAWLRRHAKLWRAWTLLYTVPFALAGVGMVILEPLAAPVAVAVLAHAWIIPELYAFRGASVVRPKGPRNADAEPVAQGFLGDLLDHDARDLQKDTGLAIEPGEMGIWLVSEAGALLVAPGGRRVHCFCVGTTDAELPPSDRIAHLLLALRTDELGFATVANHAFAGAAWRIRRRMDERVRPALEAARRASVRQVPQPWPAV